MPLFPESKALIHDLTAGQIWSRYVRYIGAGAVAAAGIVTVVRALPTMYSSLVAVLRGIRREGAGAESGEAVPRTDRDLPGWVVLAGPAVVVLALFAVPGLLAGNMGFIPRLAAALGVGLFGVAFVVVSSRIVGLIGVSSNPTSGMTLVTLLGVALVFVLFGWTRPFSPGRHPHRGHGGLHRRLEGRRHLAGPEDGIPGGRHAGRAAGRPVPGRGLRLLGRGRHRAPPRQGFHLRFGGAAGAAGHADEDGDRGRARRLSALGPGGHRRRLLPERHPGRTARPGLRRGYLPPAGDPDADLRGRPRAADGGGTAQGGRRSRGIRACWRPRA